MANGWNVKLNNMLPINVRPLVLFLLLWVGGALGSESWKMQRELYMQTMPPSNCYVPQERFINSTDLSAKIMSHYGYPLVVNKYKPNTNCTIHITAKPGNLITIFFKGNFSMQSTPCFPESMMMPTRPPCSCNDTLAFSEVAFDGKVVKEIVYCQENPPLVPYDSVTPNVSITFTTDALHNGVGFELLWTQYRPTEANCTQEEFLCDENRCLPGSLKCDGEKQCYDGSDEMEEYGCIPVDRSDLGIPMSILLYGTIINGCILIAAGFFFLVISPCSFHSYRLQLACQRLSSMGVRVSKATLAAEKEYTKSSNATPDARSQFDLRCSDIEARMT